MPPGRRSPPARWPGATSSTSISRDPIRPSSSASDGGLFAAISRRGPVAGLVGDAAYLQALLDTEAALARSQARAGLIPAASAGAIAEACTADRFDIAALGRAAAA